MTENEAVRGRALDFAGYCLSAAAGLIFGSLEPTQGDLAANAGASLDAVSNLLIAHTLGYLAGAFLFGRLYDHLPGHRLIVAAALVAAVALALAPLAGSLWLLLSLILTLGLALAGMQIGAYTLPLWQYGVRAAPYLNGLHFCFGLGVFAAPPVLAVMGSVTATYWALALFVLLAALWLLTRPSPPMPAPAQAGGPLTCAQLWLAVLGFVFLLLYVGGETGFGNWIYSYSVALRLTDKISAAYLNTAFLGMLALGRLLSIPLSARLRLSTALALDLAGSVLGAGLVLLANGPVMVWAGTLLLGLAMASIFPMMLAFAAQQTTPTARLTSLFFMGSSLGAMLLPRLIGALYDPLGPRVALVVILTVVMGQVGVYLALRAKRSVNG
ncbi:MAG: MFS transporter [Anaerolineales bacterium]|nr:MFS transporter [Anaerolineales bacterium]